MQLYTTLWQDNEPVQTTAKASFIPDLQTETPLINLYPEMRFQTLLGFGGAFTEAV